jgi:pimeloyl-ACP methyl ester carboxylesterase
MKDQSTKLTQSADLAMKGGMVLRKRLQVAQEHFAERVRGIYEKAQQEQLATPATPWALWESAVGYGIDFAQRGVLFLDTLRQRGNDFVERERAGKPPLLHFAYETVLDGRSLARPVNYALVRIVPPQGVTLDAAKRPYVIIDPRAGHGPGIGGFKDDSQVGVALREGHPVYFVIFYPEPEPGQTLPDVCAAEDQFVRKVRELHPASPKPVIVGNCQGGWAAMMLAASNPEDTGPIVINGAPMSYWGGAWAEGASDNPMRYSGGLLGGTWLSSFVSDLADGKFDGAWLVQNFENLNPANTFVDKLYHLFANVDTEAPRFLEFERWWGGFYLMNREEIEWITQNLFVGNKVWEGGARSVTGKAFDLREIRSPIILFASMGDNITPPQQAFNWVADVYGSTDEIKARGQVIVGLVHQDVGHLGIFVSGKVAKKEHAQIVEVLKSVEALPPGLYGMQIHEEKGADGKVEYRVEFVEHELEEIVGRLNRFARTDEKAFEAVTAVSDFNQRAYELFAQPLVQAMSNDASAKMQQLFHPLRAQRWMFSDLNPFMAWVKPLADMVRAQRKALEPEAPGRQAERAMAGITSAALDYYREVRDATSEAAFFQVYGNLFNFHLADKRAAEERRAAAPAELRELPVVKEALAAIEHGGYAEAVARIGALLARKGEPLPLERLHLRRELIEDYRELLPDAQPDEWRRIRGEQEIVVRYEAERALATLPALLAEAADRDRLVALFQKLLADKRFQGLAPTDEQNAMLGRIRDALRARYVAAKPAASPVLPLRAG